MSIDIASFDPVQSNLDSARFEAHLSSGRLRVSPARFVYPDGKLELELLLDATQVPKLSLSAFGENINPWLALDMAESDKRDTFNADLDIEVAVTSFGNSMHDLASHLDGYLYVNLNNGKIRKSIIDLVFLDVAGWSFGKIKRKKHVDINCGIADVTINKGMITTRAFLIDSANLAVAGQGSIDLGRETIDYALLPKKKTKLIHRANPVKINGTLNNPSTTVIPWKSAASTYGGLLFGPYIFAGQFAADVVMGAITKKVGRLKETKSPCIEYESKKREEKKVKSEK